MVERIQSVWPLYMQTNILPLTLPSTDSDIIHVRSLGRSTVVLNSADVARDILDKKGANFCDRPQFTLLEV